MPLCTIIIVHHTVLLIFLVLQTNITSRVWPSGGEGASSICKCIYLHRGRTSNVITVDAANSWWYLITDNELVHLYISACYSHLG